ncbi:MAG: putative toxin-antitoxin system toxin component, PIN family [Bacteroidales bacterium]
MEFVLDTNIIISAALFKNSVPDRSLRKALEIGNILLSGNTVAEITIILNKPKLDKYITVKDKLVFLNRILTNAKFIEVIHTINECRDPQDNMFLELALSGNADLIISGDYDLLVLNPFCSTPVITPREFIDNY